MKKENIPYLSPTDSENDEISNLSSYWIENEGISVSRQRNQGNTSHDESLDEDRSRARPGTSRKRHSFLERMITNGVMNMMYSKNYLIDKNQQFQNQDLQQLSTNNINLPNHSLNSNSNNVQGKPKKNVIPLQIEKLKNNQNYQNNYNVGGDQNNYGQGARGRHVSSHSQVYIFWEIYFYLEKYLYFVGAIVILIIGLKI